MLCCGFGAVVNCKSTLVVYLGRSQAACTACNAESHEANMYDLESKQRQLCDPPASMQARPRWLNDVYGERNKRQEEDTNALSAGASSTATQGEVVSGNIACISAVFSLYKGTL